MKKNCLYSGLFAWGYQRKVLHTSKKMTITHINKKQIINWIFTIRDNYLHISRGLEFVSSNRF